MSEGLDEGDVIEFQTTAEGAPLQTSPLRYVYEGDLVQPRYEDAGGQSGAVKAPAGAIVRTDTEGSFVELFAGGLRNAYDLAFNREGDLFTADSDTEGDMGLPWYRPPRVYHVVPSADFGWRSGWAVWPDYYLDNFPPVFDLKRGSPTGEMIALPPHADTPVVRVTARELPFIP